MESLGSWSQGSWNRFQPRWALLGFTASAHYRVADSDQAGEGFGSCLGRDCNALSPESLKPSFKCQRFESRTLTPKPQNPPSLGFSEYRVWSQNKAKLKVLLRHSVAKTLKPNRRRRRGPSRRAPGSTCPALVKPLPARNPSTGCKNT